MRLFRLFLLVSLLSLPGLLRGGSGVYVTEVPDYTWYAGCFSTTSGNCMGYWDRHGFPDFYTGPTGGGVAPLNDLGTNSGILSMCASKAGLDGRPADKPGHIDDYWYFWYDSWDGTHFSYESTQPDPYKVAGRPEHTPDCLADFVGLSQKKWTNLNNECDGNIDAFTVVFWDTNGNRRVNFTPPPSGGIPVPDVPSGLRAWTKWRGYEADVFSQLTDFNPNCPLGRGFTFNDLITEIESGYPVLVFMQPSNEFSRVLTNMPHANPHIHAVLIYGYWIEDDGTQYVISRSSWGDSDNYVDGFILDEWGPQYWQAFSVPVRGVIGYHPKPRVRSITATNNTVTIQWDGPSGEIQDLVTSEFTYPHRYVVERAPALNQPFVAITAPSTDRFATLTKSSKAGFYRVRLLGN